MIVMRLALRKYRKERNKPSEDADGLEEQAGRGVAPTLRVGEPPGCYFVVARAGFEGVRVEDAACLTRRFRAR